MEEEDSLLHHYELIVNQQEIDKERKKEKVEEAQSDICQLNYFTIHLHMSVKMTKKED